MDLVQSSLPFIFVLLSGYILKYSCDAFESSAGYLSRNMSSGIKGATINAVGSSMPELFTVVATLFFFDDPQMFAIGLGVTAGSAIFNGCVIPAFSILLARDEKGQKVRAIVLDKPSLIRDIFWVLLAEVALVLMLGQSQLTLWMAVLLNLIYVGYAYHIYRHARASGEDEIEAYEEAQMPDYGVIGNIFTFNVNGLLFGNRGYSTFRALTVLSTCIVIISGASHLLVVGVMGVSDVVGIPAFVSGLVLGAAASSIPDLILSIKDAAKGDYQDAVSNPLASNTFDTTISIALPLVVWLIWKGESGIPLEQGDELVFLRWSIIWVTVAVASALLFKYKNITKKVASFLLAVYVIWFAIMFYMVA